MRRQGSASSGDYDDYHGQRQSKRGRSDIAYVLSSDQTHSTQLGTKRRKKSYQIPQTAKVKSSRSSEYLDAESQRRIDEVRQQARLRNQKTKLEKIRQGPQLVTDDDEVDSGRFEESIEEAKVPYQDRQVSNSSVSSQTRRQMRKANQQPERRGFQQFMKEFYPRTTKEEPQQTTRSRRWRRYQQPEPSNQPKSQRTLNQLFEPTQQPPKGSLSNRHGSAQWKCKATKEGFVYFYLPGTNTFQWSFPVVFDPISGRKKTLFAETWMKKYDEFGHKFYRDQESGLTQEVRPDSETYLIQAAMLGNICFLKLYLKARGFLGITDKRGRTALHLSVANGHKQLSLMLCEFGAFENLLETADTSGNTPLLVAVKYNQNAMVKVLIQFNANLFHRNLKGDSCLHVAALNNSGEVIPSLVSFLTEEMFEQRNRDGMTPLEIATSLQNFSLVRDLEAAKRNLTVQSALTERNIMYPGNGARRQSKAKNQFDASSQEDPPAYQSDRQFNHRKVQQSKRHQKEILAQTERMDRAKVGRLTRPPQVGHSERKREGELQFNQFRQNRHGSRSERLTIDFGGFNDEEHREINRQFDSEESLERPSREQQSLHMSSSRIQESYFDDEMQAKVHRSARQRQRQLSERGGRLKRRDILDTEERSNFDRALSQTTRVVQQVGSFFKSKYHSLMQYLYDETPRLTFGTSGTNRIMQAPPSDLEDDSVLLERESILPPPFRRHQEDSASSDHQRRPRSHHSAALPQNYSDEEDSIGFVTAFSKSRSRSVARRAQTSRSVRRRDLQTLPNEGQDHNNFQLRVNPHSDYQSPSRKLRGQASDKQVRFPAEESLGEEQPPQTVSISVQADPVPSRRAKTQRNDISKRSVGVGSICIDDTLEASKARLSLIEQSSRVSRKKGGKKKKGNQAKNQSPQMPTKDYLSAAEAQTEMVKAQAKAQEQDPQRESSEFKFQSTTAEKISDKPQQVSPSPGNRLQKFYEKLAEHEQLSESEVLVNSRIKSEMRQDFHFNPLEQDEENYALHQSNAQNFTPSDTEALVLADLEQELLDNISQCSFEPRDTKERKQLGLSRVSALDKGQFLQQSCGSIQEDAGRGKGGTLLPIKSYLTPLTTYQSDSEAPKRRIKLPRLPRKGPVRNESPAQPTAQIGASRPDSALLSYPERQAPVPQLAQLETEKRQELSKEQQVFINLFCSDTESARLRTAPGEPNQNDTTVKRDIDTSVPLSEPPSELFFKGNETLAQERKHLEIEEAKTTKTVISQASSKVVSHPTTTANNRYGGGDTTTTNEDLTLLNFDLSKDVSHSRIQNKSSRGAIFPPVDLVHHKRADLMDELDEISRIEQETQGERGQKAPVTVPQSEPIGNLAAQPMPKEKKLAEIDFYRKPSDEAEVVFNPPTEDELVIQRRQLRKQNKSAAVLKNHFLSSASEDENDGPAQARANREKALRRARIKGAAMHSSVNNGNPLPLYGQKAKGITKIAFKGSETAEQQPQASEKGSLTVSERFKQSLKAFKSNKLIKAGAGTSMNTSKNSVASTIKLSKSPARDTQT